MSAAVTHARAVLARLPRQERSPWPARRVLQLLLGTVWLLDAALQFQPYMFSRAFVTQIISPVTAGNPAVIARPITWSAQIMAQHIVPANTAFALIQLSIAAGLFFRRTVKLALAASIVWSVFVWFFGEGLGGILTGASPLAGAPGAVILYALIALLIWPADEVHGAAPLAPALRGPLGQRVPKLTWFTLWTAFACYLLLPANRAPGAVSQAFISMTAGQPGWLTVPARAMATLTAGHGQAAAVALAALCVLTGAGIFADQLTRPALILATLLGLLIWTAEGFGTLTTGHATDPNTGPLLILLAACFWPPHRDAAPAGGADHSPSRRAALAWHTARSHAVPRSSRARAWSWCR
jgi:hypothetical protein